MKEDNLFTRFWVQVAFFFLWGMISVSGNLWLARGYLLMILAFAFVNGRVRTKRSALYTAAPVLYVGFISFILSFMQVLQDGAGLFGGILTWAALSPSVSVHMALSIGEAGYELFNPVTVQQLLIFAVMQAAAFGLGYLYSNRTNTNYSDYRKPDRTGA